MSQGIAINLNFALMRRNPHSVDGLNPMIVFNPNYAYFGQREIPFWPTENRSAEDINGFETDEERFGLKYGPPRKETFDYYFSIGDFVVEDSSRKRENYIWGAVAKDRYERYEERKLMYALDTLFICY